MLARNGCLAPHTSRLLISQERRSQPRVTVRATILLLSCHGLETAMRLPQCNLSDLRIRELKY